MYGGSYKINCTDTNFKRRLRQNHASPSKSETCSGLCMESGSWDMLKLKRKAKNKIDQNLLLWLPQYLGTRVDKIVPIQSILVNLIAMSYSRTRVQLYSCTALLLILNSSIESRKRWCPALREQQLRVTTRNAPATELAVNFKETFHHLRS